MLDTLAKFSNILDVNWHHSNNKNTFRETKRGTRFEGVGNF